ncbi:MAG: NAD(P)H-dependent oxidoreductase subunit E [Proteiniphilum sp.]|jgi:NADH-quinone oxidoreductase subunit E/NADP-reducing hydrogenase subunit HndA|nr:NAD(P)H-dependent oxidoreductase subunit E [Proteiniphilum sp.]
MNRKINEAPEVFECTGKTASGGAGIKESLTEEKLAKISEICNTFGNDPGELINVLHEVQHAFGYIPAEVQEAVARNLHLSAAQVYGVVTFYTFFSMIPKGEHPISVCTGTACHVRGAESVLEEFRKELQLEVGETSSDGKFSLNCLRCVGACGLAPVVLVGERVYGRVSPDGVKAIIAEYREKKLH